MQRGIAYSNEECLFLRIKHYQQIITGPVIGYII
jgi:hypothetical protein